MENCDIEEPMSFAEQQDAAYGLDDWCELCGDERPCECDTQLSAEYDAEAEEVRDYPNEKERVNASL